MTAVKCFFAVEIAVAPGRSGQGQSHRHPCTELVWYRKGFGKLGLTGDEPRLYSPGMVAAYPAGMEHRDRPDSPGLQFCVGVSGCGAEELCCPPSPVDPPMLEALENLRRETENPPPRFRAERLDLLAGLAVLNLARISRDALPEPGSRAARLRDILDARFDEELDLAALAGTLFVSGDYLRHCFKREYGESPVNYLIRRRIEAACELLNMTALPVGEIARRVGIENVYYFCRLFRKKLGVSPTRYRRDKRTAT